jgi:hypothetical protein
MFVVENIIIGEQVFQNPTEFGVLAVRSFAI